MSQIWENIYFTRNVNHYFCLPCCNQGLTYSCLPISELGDVKFIST